MNTYEKGATKKRSTWFGFHREDIRFPPGTAERCPPEESWKVAF
jgi:hypothetical protein